MTPELLINQEEWKAAAQVMSFFFLMKRMFKLVNLAAERGNLWLSLSTISHY